MIIVGDRRQAGNTPIYMRTEMVEIREGPLNCRSFDRSKSFSEFWSRSIKFLRGGAEVFSVSWVFVRGHKVVARGFRVNSCFLPPTRQRR